MASVIQDGLEFKLIWFWQVDRYLRAGWQLSWDCWSWNPLRWPGALFDAIWPIVMREVRA